MFPSFIKFILSTLMVLIYLLLGIFTSAAVMEATTKDSFISKHRMLSVAVIVLFWPLFYFYGLCAIIYKTIIEIKLKNQ